jgi:uncharacterized protein (DUF2147 family)
MSKRHSIKHDSHAALPQANKRPAKIWVGIGLAVVIVMCAGVIWWWKTNHAQASRPAAVSIQPAAGQAAAAAAPNFDKLKGKWLRPDGGYVLEIKQVASDGKMDAAYLNPRPINVSQAAASSEAGKINVFVELRDRLYPGNYYKLIYDAGKDQLAGVYYHLGINQQFDVVFVRME